jgi:hypothetical protein
MKDRAGNELEVGDHVLYLNPGTSTSWLVWGTVDSFTPKMVRLVPDKKGFLQDTLLRDPRSVVKPQLPKE